ncbi:MAG: DUF3662 domain-containing protein [Chloroflexota bacterium]|nr:DUF3662 domain-containing protein [Chloroflexota bacterium]
MAGPLAAIERFFERLFERPPARLFTTPVEKEQLVRQLQRAMEAERHVRRQRTYAPSLYGVRLNAADLAALGNTSALVDELSEALRQHARSRGYTLAVRPQVVLEPAAGLASGEVQVTAVATAIGVGRREDGAAGESGQQAAGQESGAPRPPHPGGGVDSNTAVFEAARPRVPNATIAVRVPGHPAWRVPVRGGRLRVGRALDNDIVLPDDGVSRHHGQINVRFGTLVYSDLGSTNGSFVNGARVTEIALGPTDVLLLGRSSLTIEPGT